MHDERSAPERGGSRWHLRGRLIALGVLPVVCAGAAVAAMLLRPAAPIVTREFWALVIAAFAAAAIAALVAAFALARRIVRPFDAMLRYSDGADEEAVRNALQQNASREVYQLFRRVQQLVLQNRAGRRALEEVEDVAREAERLGQVLAMLPDENVESLPRLNGTLTPVGAALGEFLRRRGRVRHEAQELSRQLGETLRELQAAVGELAARAEKGYLAATGAAFAQREMEKRLDQTLRPPDQADETWTAARAAADEAGRIENRLAVMALRHSDDAPAELLNDLRGAIERVRALETGTREAMQQLEAALAASQNGYRVTEAGVEALKEKNAELTMRIAEASSALEATSRAAERARRLAALASREVEGFRRHLAADSPPPAP